MTLPNERTRAVVAAREFLRDLLNSSRTPRVPKAVRERARSVLRHFPWDMHIDEAAELLPEVWGTTEKELE